MRNIHRRSFVLSSLLLSCLCGEEISPNPWSKAELLQPEELRAMLNTPKQVLTIICVTFPVLYRQKHIPHAQLAGPASKPDGIVALQAAAGVLSGSSDIVIYCGCCPMKTCPNLAPAYRALKEMAFRNVRVLDLPTNFHSDWVAKGYPIEP